MTTTGTFELALSAGGVDDEMVNFTVDVVADFIDGRVEITSVLSSELIDIIPQDMLDRWTIALAETAASDVAGSRADHVWDEWRDRQMEFTKSTQAMFDRLTGRAAE